MTLAAMKEIAHSENIAARKTWDKQTKQIHWATPDKAFNKKLVPRVMSCLREGLGVEDMQAQGTCTEDEARQIIAWMRANGSLEKFYKAKAERKSA